ncbi:MAG: hypothetical protein ACFNW0_01750 [Fretibacterium sp.]
MNTVASSSKGKGAKTIPPGAKDSMAIFRGYAVEEIPSFLFLRIKGGLIFVLLV